MVHPFELVQHFSHMLLQAGHNKKRVSQIPALMQNVFFVFPPYKYIFWRHACIFRLYDEKPSARL